MQKSLFLLALCFYLTISISPTFSEAADANDEKIIQLLQIMKTDENMETSLESMKQTIKLNSSYFLQEIEIILAREFPEDKVQAAVAKFREDDFGSTRLYELFRYKFSLDRIKKEIILPLYKQHYTGEEIQQLINFYTSEIGQKTLQLTPTISRSISEKTREISQMALDQAKEKLAAELTKDLNK